MSNEAILRQVIRDTREIHQAEPGGCTCGFCAWSVEHVDYYIVEALNAAIEQQVAGAYLDATRAVNENVQQGDHYAGYSAPCPFAMEHIVKIQQRTPSFAREALERHEKQVQMKFIKEVFASGAESLESFLMARHRELTAEAERLYNDHH